MRGSIATGLIVVALVAQPDTSFACSCVHRSPERARDAAAAVFTGLVTAVTLDTKWIDSSARRPGDCRTLISGDEDGVALCEQGQVAVRFRVFKSWKGATANELIVRTDSQVTACGVDFRVGGIYLVYAVGEVGGALETSRCLRTRVIGEAQGDIDVLGPPERDAFQQGLQREPPRP
ncbi:MULTISPECIES: hypothetical protein [unclassified Roseateles]|uniref:hypothetical protein n=1 Tax=unclassified Roseateles TaxID=2626991 RepID=UPI00071267DE|nr:MULTISPECIES: hypothetical protein [unclassified Roseateles]KQW43639.1 hypothetical protein ASC81_17940 [Pelomonas sp. Root405]KRA71377.1 hypothetical protein ASD88_16460 [Pelomonas sp. Root662]